MSNLSETLQELMLDNGLDNKTLANRIGISPSRITDYVRNDKLPTVNNLILLADYFGCSTDFLLGRTYENPKKEFSASMQISEKIDYLIKKLNTSVIRVSDEAHVTKSRLYDWLNGTRQPSLDNLIKLANYFACSVDYLLGREN